MLKGISRPRRPRCSHELSRESFDVIWTSASSCCAACRRSPGASSSTLDDLEHRKR
jgi:hypothetical protein